MAHFPSMDLLSCIERIQELHRKQNLIRQAEETLSLGKLLDKEQEEALCSKPSVVHQMELLREFMKETSSGPQVPLIKEPMSTVQSVGQAKAAEEEEEEEEEANANAKAWYVCITDGLVICSLELKYRNREYKDGGSIPFICKANTLKMVEGRRLVSAGLFKLGSDAYIVGGQALADNPSASDVRKIHLEPCGIDLYNYFFQNLGTSPKGLSRSIHRLSVDDLGILSMGGSHSHLPELGDPKVWSIVEKIDDQLHVITSRPRIFPFWDSASLGSTHEFLDSTDWTWTRISAVTPLLELRGIYSHLVVGTRIYAVGSSCFFVFDSKTQTWEEFERDNSSVHPFCIEQVWEFLGYGHGRCAGEFRFPLQQDSSSSPLFVVIAVVHDVGTRDYSARVVAYLVTSTGEVLCFQQLHHFFWKELRPMSYSLAQVINVDDDLFCVVVNGKAFGRFGDLNLLFFNTFTVEGLLAEAASRVAQIREETDKSDLPVELEFVRVHVKDRYVYKLEDYESDDSDLVAFDFLQACFL